MLRRAQIDQIDLNQNDGESLKKIDIEARADGDPQRLVVAADLTEANGYAEREAAESDDRASCTGRLSLGADKGYDANSRRVS